MIYKNVFITRPDGEPEVTDGHYLYATLVGFREDGYAYFVPLNCRLGCDDETLKLKEIVGMGVLRKALREMPDSEAVVVNSPEDIISLITKYKSAPVLDHDGLPVLSNPLWFNCASSLDGWHLFKPWLLDHPVNGDSDFQPQYDGRNN